MRTVSILGSTGSIGTQALDVCRFHGLEVFALAACANVKLLAEQVQEFNPEIVCIYDESKLEELKSLLSVNAGKSVKILTGKEGLCDIASETKTDVLLNAMSGIRGLAPTLTAIENGVDIALANKETLVVAGHLVMSSAQKHGVKIIPVDSEHSAIYQVIQGTPHEKIAKIILTASGGPFLGMNFSELQSVTLKDALSHPTWNMGRKITVDSATLMNKGLEVIEAKYLFGLSHEQIEVVVHKQSVVHSAVEFIDGSVVAQLGSPDMRLPIQYALLDSERLTSPAKKLNLLDYPNLTFEKPDVKTFNCLGLAYDALEAGEAAPAVLNSANDFAVDSFCNDEIKFTDIPLIVANALRQFGNKFLESQSVEDIQKINIAVHNTLSKDFFKERT